LPFFFASLRRPVVVVAMSVAAADAGLAVAGCNSTNPDDVIGADATDDQTIVTPDAQKDSPVTRPDAGKDVTTCPTPVKGDCDIVAQDCPKDSKGRDQECVVTSAGGTSRTECVAVQATQQLPIGRGCCPSTAENPGNPCLPGLTCVGQPCEDGGAPSGRCSPACCEGDDQVCGKSEPEGISGACDLVLVDENNKELHSVCSYRERCKPFKVEPCRAGQICIVEDKLGTASCVSSFGKGNGQGCTFANECADGFVCVGSGDAGRCRTVCLIPGSTHPFDAGVEEGGAGRGGCPTGERCNGFSASSNLPSWFGACSDGGI